MPNLRSNLRIAAGVARSFVPFRPWLRRIKRKFSPYHGNLGNSRLAFEQGLRQIEMLREAGANLSGGVLEIGTGWLPIIPMLFRIAGASRIVLADVERLMDEHTVAEAARLIAERAATVSSRLGLPPDTVRAKTAEPFCPDYIVPWRPSDIPPRSVDIIVPRTTFEHIPPKTLDNYLAAFDGMLRPGGMMCHFIDNSDHWQHRDPALSRINMLRYEDGWRWRLMCHAEYLNRLRHSDYTELFDRRGWRTVHTEAIVDENALASLQSLPLAMRFQRSDPRDLAAVRSIFVVERLGGD